jgi:hypothetical protein
VSYVIREVYPLGGHNVTDNQGNVMFFRSEQDAEKTAATMNRMKKDATRLFIVVPDPH